MVVETSSDHAHAKRHSSAAALQDVERPVGSAETRLTVRGGTTTGGIGFWFYGSAARMSPVALALLAPGTIEDPSRDQAADVAEAVAYGTCQEVDRSD